jgi:hypothetical protein
MVSSRNIVKLGKYSVVCFMCRILVASNAIQTMYNEMTNFIIYCLNCFRCDQNSTYETGLSIAKLVMFVHVIQI